MVAVFVLTTLALLLGRIGHHRLAVGTAMGCLVLAIRVGVGHAIRLRRTALPALFVAARGAARCLLRHGSVVLQCGLGQCHTIGYRWLP